MQILSKEWLNWVQVSIYKLLKGYNVLSDSIDKFIQEGILLNGKILIGTKSKINETDLLIIPVDYEYIASEMDVAGVIEINGKLTII